MRPLSCFALIFLSMLLSPCFSRYNACGDEAIHTTADYTTAYNKGDALLASGQYENAKDYYLCSLRSSTLQYQSYLKLGIIYQNYIKDSSTGRYCFVKSLAAGVHLDTHDELAALQQLLGIYTAWENRFAALFYEELIEVKSVYSNLSGNVGGVLREV